MSGFLYRIPSATNADLTGQISPDPPRANRRPTGNCSDGTLSKDIQDISIRRVWLKVPCSDILRIIDGQDSNSYIYSITFTV